MKHSIFKIRAIGSNQKAIEDQGDMPNDGDRKGFLGQKFKVEDIFGQMKKMIEDSINKQTAAPNLQARDRHLSISNNAYSVDKFSNDSVQAWIGKVSQDVMSSAYYYYLNEEMNYEQTKIYCCRQILTNISQFVESNKNQINPQFYSIVDRILKLKVFPYLELKYPPSISNQVNKRLNKVFKEINNMEVITNDFFYSSDITFQYREDGIYNDLIMQVINQIIKITDLNVLDGIDKDIDNKTNFEDFQEFMSELFEKVYDQEWMIKGMYQRTSKYKKTYEREEQQRQKYKEQVKEYTHYLIGKKIPQDVQEFDQFQIKSGFINIKSPTILRIITKWCEQLWQKFDNENYYIDRTEGITMQKGKQVNIIYPWLKKDLKLKMAEEKTRILQYMKKIQTSNYEQQYGIMQNQQSLNQALFIDRHERICGKFSLKIVKNLQNYILVYLNRLIHGLMQVSKLVYKSMTGMPSWPYPPNLLSFKIGDLLRCKCSSKQRQILRIFQQIQQISQNNPQKLKIIRIKNRLRLGTNDILINVRFNNCFTAQIQLKVQTKSSESQISLHSYNFSHLIYQIKRSYFGPITEMCSIWTNLDPRVQMFKKLIVQQKPVSQQKEFNCLKKSQFHSFVNADNNPFICSQCGKAYSNNNYVIPHYKCTKCIYWKCAICIIKQKEAFGLIDLIIQNEQLKINCSPVRCKSLPKYSVGTLIQSKLKEICYFKVIDAFQKKYLFKIVNNQSQQLFKQFNTSKSILQFLKEYIIFELEPNFIKSLPQLNDHKAIIDQILPSYTKKCYKFNKQTISLNSLKQFGVKATDLVRILQGSKQQKKCIKFIQLSSNDINQIQFLTHQFKNLQFLNVNINNIKELKHLGGFTKLQTLFAISNKITHFPSQVCNLKLKYISLYNNQLANLPPEFSQLHYLQTLRLNSNKIVDFPENFGQMQNLKELYMNNNKISNIDNLTCPKLQYVDLSGNDLKKIPHQIQLLANLHYFNVKSNKITVIETQFTKLKKLKELIIATNYLTNISTNLYGCPQLISLDISYEKFPSLDLNGGLFPNLKDINLQNCGINEIKGFQSLKNIKQLKLNNNNLQKLPEEIYTLSNMNVLKLSFNKLTELPSRFGQLSKLRELLLDSNHLNSFPVSFFNLKLQILNFSSNKFSEIPSELVLIKSLKSLQFENNSIEILPSTIASLQNLSLLNFSRTKIQQVPSQLNNLKKLKKIMFKSTPLVNLPPILLNFSCDFNGYNLKCLQEGIPRLQNIEKLQFNNNLLQTIPNSISQIVNLKYLYLNNNQLAQICEGIFSLSLLNTLSMINNQIVTIPNNITRLTQLKSLLLSNNKIQIIPDCLQNQLKNGLNIEFKQNPIITIPQWIFENQKQFKDKINLFNLKLKRLPKRLSNAMKYIQINISSNELQIFPQLISQCSHLKTLDLSKNQIKDLSNGTFDFQHLSNLNLSGNMIEEIPENFSKLTNLIQLNLSKNPIKKLYQSFKQIHLNSLWIDLKCFQDLSKTKSLQWIHTNKVQIIEDLEALPQCFGEIGYLKQFSFAGRLLKRLPESFTNLSNLTKLSVQCKNFEQLPKHIGNLCKLQYIKLNCNISNLPQSFSNLINLSSLFLNDNKLQQLPEYVGNLTQLKEISVRSNNLTKLPNSISKLRKLEILSFRFNKIAEIPSELGRCSMMKSIYAEDNLIKVIPKELQQLIQIKPGQLRLEGNPIQEIECFQYVIQRGNNKTKQLANQLKTSKQLATQIPNINS